MNPSNGRNQRDIQLVSAGIINDGSATRKWKMEAKKGTIQSDAEGLGSTLLRKCYQMRNSPRPHQKRNQVDAQNGYMQK